MKYVALLRGINVGGNNIIKMLDLKTCFEKSGYTNVLTYIQSGNVIFESSEKDAKKLEEQIEKILSKTFNYQSKVMIRSLDELKKVLSNVPSEWKNTKDIRCYVSFLKDSLSTKDALSEIQINEEVDSIKAGGGVLYMTTLMSGLTKSRFNKLAASKIYKDMTIRNYNTTQKIAALMDK